ncbi:MAG TPA: NAD(P)(+) transhydrogenase (Re/Si-specific) subunit beta [Vicinamibacteria bacterium]|nr:NAD(P)(+) transhydrogenase (Re/Si-specific) subunit beta [Vicinamibacteria bacterium]
MPAAFENLVYLVSGVLFILAFKGLAHPRTAGRGNLLGATGMLLAVAVTLFDRHILGFGAILGGLVLGSAIGAALALKVRMTAMPQMVALLNGLGGGASVLVAGAAVLEADVVTEAPRLQMAVATVFSGLIGAVTFWGSLVAFAKLAEVAWAKDVRFSGQQAVNAALLLACLVLAAPFVRDPAAFLFYWALVGVASVLGVLVVIPIGGANMPIVICLLNSYSGLAAAATGFVLDNNGLIIAGSLVGASGIILTRIMCRAMNQSMADVLFGAPVAGAAESGDAVYGGKVKSVSPEELAMVFDAARRVVIVPGYGMAVSQAQHVVRDLANLLQGRGVEVEYGIHPVAGRMPGHMNVLLAEAGIPYEKVKEMEQINPTFAETDVAVVIGANDVVNPVARQPRGNPIAGMPILDVDKARTCVVIKRSLSPGFAGIPNPLFAADNTLMLFGDGKRAVLDLIGALEEG